MAEFTKQIRGVNDYERFKSLVEQKYNSKVIGHYQEKGIGVLELANGDEVKYWDDKKLIGNPFGRRGKDNRIPAHFTKTKYSEWGYKVKGDDKFITNYAVKFGADTLAYAKSLGLTQAQIRKAEASGAGNADDERLALREFAFPKPVNPITLRKEPVQAVRGGGTWQVEVVGDIHDLSEARLKSYQSLAGSSIQPTTHLQGDLVELIFIFDTKTAAEGAVSRLQGHPDFGKSKDKALISNLSMTLVLPAPRNPMSVSPTPIP